MKIKFKKYVLKTSFIMSTVLKEDAAASFFWWGSQCVHIAQTETLSVAQFEQISIPWKKWQRYLQFSMYSNTLSTRTEYC